MLNENENLDLNRNSKIKSREVKQRVNEVIDWLKENCEDIEIYDRDLIMGIKRTVMIKCILQAQNHVKLDSIKRAINLGNKVMDRKRSIESRYSNLVKLINYRVD